MATLTVGSEIRAEGLPPKVERRARLAVTLPNRKHEQAVRAGRWPGAIPRELTLARDEGGSLILPRGFLPRLVELLREEGVPFELVDQRLDLPRVDLAFRGELRTYQARALEALTDHGSGVVEAPPGSGKTVLAMALVAHWQRPALLIAHTKDLVAQLSEAVRRFLGVEPGFIGDGTWDPRSPVTVALVQSLTRNPERTDELAREAALVLLDEAHHAPAITFTETLGRFPAAFRFGMTATPDRPDGLGPFVQAVIGPIRARVTTHDLEAAGLLVRPRLVWVETGFRYTYRDDWTDMIGALVSDEPRNALIRSLAASAIREGRRTLILTERIAHAEELAGDLERLFPRRVAALTGNVPAGRRATILEGFRGGALLGLTATQLADEGLDVPELEALILATPARAASRVSQRVGRLLRPAPGKRTPVVYDLEDLRVGILRSQAKARWKLVYKDLVGSWERLEEVS